MTFHIFEYLISMCFFFLFYPLCLFRLLFTFVPNRICWLCSHTIYDRTEQYRCIWRKFNFITMWGWNNAHKCWSFVNEAQIQQKSTRSTAEHSMERTRWSRHWHRWRYISVSPQMLKTTTMTITIPIPIKSTIRMQWIETSCDAQMCRFLLTGYTYIPGLCGRSALFYTEKSTFWSHFPACICLIVYFGACIFVNCLIQDPTRKWLVVHQFGRGESRFDWCLSMFAQ